MLLGVALVLLTLVTFAPVRGFDFVTYDDFEFVVDNEPIRGGLTLDGVRWALRHPYDATGGPLTWLSHMLDVESFGLDAGGHHVTNLVLHAANVALLFALLARLTGSLWKSGFVAALFALHPLHVESVAWVSQRKDLLSTLFWILTIWAYGRYAARPAVGRYLAVAALLAAGLMSKPMLVTLPFTLLLLDAWPLGRLRRGPSFRRDLARLTAEKLPLLGLGCVAILLTFLSQRTLGAVSPLESIPPELRLANAAVSYVAYLGKTAWPVDLAPYYPYRPAVPWTAVAGSLAILIGLTAGAAALWRRLPAVTVGWFWYVATMVPVIGLVQVGGHAMADRFTYVPLIGIFVAIAWGVPALAGRFGVPGPAVAAGAVAAVIMCVPLTREQAQHWRDGVSLWEHAVRTTPHSGRAHANLGVAYGREGRMDAAIHHYREAIRLGPPSAQAHNNLALALSGKGLREEAVAHARRAVEIRPGYANARSNLAALLADRGELDEALPHYEEAVRLAPSNVLARAGLALALAQSGRHEAAIPHMLEVARLDPGQARWHYAAGVLLLEAGRVEDARTYLEQTLRLDPEHAGAARALSSLPSR